MGWCKKSKFNKAEINLSNIEIFNALVDRLSLQFRWKERIKRHFCREKYFNQLLNKLSSKTDISPNIIEKDKKIADKLKSQDGHPTCFDSNDKKFFITDDYSELDNNSSPTLILYLSLLYEEFKEANFLL